MTASLRRAAADECLRTVFGDHYGKLTIREGELLVTDLIGLDDDEHVRDLFESARILRDRIGGPNKLVGYAATLEAGKQARKQSGMRIVLIELPNDAAPLADASVSWEVQDATGHRISGSWVEGDSDLDWYRAFNAADAVRRNIQKQERSK